MNIDFKKEAKKKEQSLWITRSGLPTEIAHNDYYNE
jgi:hypothetical protein